MPSYGVNVTDGEMAEWIEDQRIRTDESGSRDLVSRSQVIREAVELDKAVTDVLENPPADVASEAYLPRRDDRRGFARQLVLDALRYRSESRE